ncbi:hypothetical protein [Azospirillum melinis]
MLRSEGRLEEGPEPGCLERVMIPTKKGRGPQRTAAEFFLV